MPAMSWEGYFASATGIWYSSGTQTKSVCVAIREGALRLSNLGRLTLKTGRAPKRAHASLSDRQPGPSVPPCSNALSPAYKPAMIAHYRNGCRLLRKEAARVLVGTITPTFFPQEPTGARGDPRQHRISGRKPGEEDDQSTYMPVYQQWWPITRKEISEVRMEKQLRALNRCVPTLILYAFRCFRTY